MTMSDPIADFLTRIRNAQMALKKWVDIPSSALKIRIHFIAITIILEFYNYCLI